ncbi:GPI biosynthesis protein family Pig-F-domain-containing protein [Aspergillus coremiiformis]|uniref:GPI biosynthesis protein family Pig-F-domain-containing protein n=1 Tax=Aspergillus coremiiformis TaxID=138285 RepID=A0A5N6YT77_9EURO|nr:GPI biosynthesis protein family Pig-F-domain-containing protein [Aspergillus coremiiformis]
MSSTPPSPSLTQPPSPPKSTPPTHILPNTISKTYALLHPLLLLTLLTTRFNALVTNPTTELLTTLPPLALLQLTFAITCLPPTGTKEKDDEEKPKQKPSPRRKPPKPDSTWFAAKIITKPQTNNTSSRPKPAILSLTLTTLLAIPVLTILLVLFGAPLTTHHPQTLLCAAHMAVLTATALVYVHGVDGGVWREVWGASRPADAVWGGALGSCVGAWFGAVPIPLDWDRPWQAFPITIVVGAYIGYAVGVGLGRTVLFGKRLKIEDEGEGDLGGGERRVD